MPLSDCLCIAACCIWLLLFINLQASCTWSSLRWTHVPHSLCKRTHLVTHFTAFVFKVGDYMSNCCCTGQFVWVPAGELYLEFTQIDPQQPERPFGFAVTVVGDDNRYTGGRGWA